MNKLRLSKNLRIAVVAPSRPSELFGQLWKGIWTAACELAAFGVRVDSFESDNHDLAIQKRLLASLREKSPSAIALVPSHGTELNQEIAQLASLDIPVVTFHTDASSSLRTNYVGTDPAQSGALAGHTLAMLLRGGGTVASFPGSLETDHLKRRYRAFRTELKNRAPNVTEFVSQSGYSGLVEATRRIISEDQSLQGIYVGCSRAHQVAQVLAEAGLKIPLVGFDLTELSRPYLHNGAISALIDEDIYHQGYIALHLAYEMIGSDPSEKATISPLPATVMFGVNASHPETLDPGLSGLDHLIRIRTERVHRYRELLEHASSQIVLLTETDPLTGLLNRSKFEEVLSSRANNNERLSILTVGLDGFEHANHDIGQPVGDEVLKTVAKLLQAMARPQDDCARIGDDEFCILMPGADSTEVAEARERILSAISRTVIAPRTLHLGIRVSAGAATLPTDAFSAEDLLVIADNSRYAHKRSASSATHSTRVPGPGASDQRGEGRPFRMPA